MGAVAAAYAEVGWPVFPVWGLRRSADRWVCRCPDGPTCASPAKHPHALAPHGFHDATADSAQAAAWWARDHSANIGLACGVIFDVLDVDHEEFLIGVADLPDCETDGGPVVVTGRGRFHLYFAATGLGRRIRFSAHCDWLGRGGYVIAPPSRHVCGGHYEWYGETGTWTPLTQPPEPLRDVLDPPVRYSILDRATHRDANGPTARSRNTQARRAWNPHGLFDRLATAVEGERNTILHWCAARIGEDVAAGVVPQSAALAALDDLAATAAAKGLSGREIDATIRSGYRRGTAG
jgi:hypothetical protein